MSINKKYLDYWEQFVVPYIKNKDYESAKHEATHLLIQLTDELGQRELSYKLWKLYSNWTG